MEKSNYKLPEIKKYIKNVELAKSLQTCNNSAFISLISDNEVKNISFYDCSNLLIYGISKSGKSCFIESIITNILLKSSPNESKLIIIDTKQLEYNGFNGLPHLLMPVITNKEKSILGLNKIVEEINNRYDLFITNGVKDISAYNQSLGEKSSTKLPNIYIIVDDLMDFVDAFKAEITEEISTIIRRGRQVGVFIIVATSNIDANFFKIGFINSFSNRICFKARSERDSRLLLDKNGAQNLERYEFYFNSTVNEFDGKYKSYKVDEQNLRDLIDYIIREQPVKYEKSNDITSVIQEETKVDTNEEFDEPLYDQIVEFAIQTGKVSAALLQRRFKVGYNRAAHIVDLLEERGIIGPANGSKPRDVLIKIEKKDDINKCNAVNNIKKEKINRILYIIAIVLGIIFILSLFE